MCRCGIITSLAFLLITVGAFSTSGIVFIKLLGVGMMIALVVDARIVRVLLVPATVRLLGRANRWAPRPLRRLYARYGIGEAERGGPRFPSPPAPEPLRKTHLSMPNGCRCVARAGVRSVAGTFR